MPGMAPRQGQRAALAEPRWQQLVVPDPINGLLHRQGFTCTAVGSSSLFIIGGAR